MYYFLRGILSSCAAANNNSSSDTWQPRIQII